MALNGTLTHITENDEIKDKQKAPASQNNKLVQTIVHLSSQEFTNMKSVYKEGGT